MVQINLLPWREERRERLQKEFIVITGAVVLSALMVVFLWDMFVNSNINAQRGRNTFMQKNIEELSAQVKEIKTLQEQREALIERMKVIQDLQGRRPEIVHIFDEIARTIPDGVYYTAVERVGKKITIRGTSESNNRVSSLMRRLDSSAWFSEPNLIGVTANPDFGEQANDFSLTVNVSAPKVEAVEKSN